MRTRKNGDKDKPLKTVFVGIRLDPLENDYATFISTELSKQNHGMTVTKSDVIRMLIREKIAAICKRNKINPVEIIRMMRERGTD